MLPMLYDSTRNLSTEEQRERAAEALSRLVRQTSASPPQSKLFWRAAAAWRLPERSSTLPLITADRPTGNLDSKSSVEIMDLLHNLHATGVTIVMVTHEPDIARHARRIICVRDGNIVDDGVCAESHP